MAVKNTLLLDQSTWDLCLDVHGNIAMATAPYALAQDAASAVRTFKNEVWYDTTVGVPYWDQVLGKLPSVALLKALFKAECLRVPGCSDATCFLGLTKGRVVIGQIQVKAGTDITASINIGNMIPQLMILDETQLGGPEIIGHTPTQLNPFILDVSFLDGPDHIG